MSCPCPPPRTINVREPVPPDMVAPVPFPVRHGDTCDSLGQWSLLWADAWKQGNLKLDSIRLWGEGK
jgi:hypothetical protein